MAGKKPAFWVSMTDSFLSGWGPAEGKINKLIFPCETREEAEIVSENARARSDMQYVYICIHKPWYNAMDYLVSQHDKTDYDSFYIKGAFAQGAEQ